MTEENISHLRVVCASCEKVSEPDTYSTAGPLCPKCVRSATRVERLLFIGGVTYRQILKEEKKQDSPATAAGRGSA